MPAKRSATPIHEKTLRREKDLRSGAAMTRKSIFNREILSAMFETANIA